MTTWKLWKGGFDRWEKATAEYLESTLQKASVLGPSANLLRVVMQAKIESSRIVGKGMRAIGLTSRDQQDLALHRINQLESHVLDLQEELQELREQREQR